MTARRLEVIVDGAPHVVEIENPDASPMTVRVDGRAFQVEVREGEARVVEPASRVPHPTEQRSPPAPLGESRAAPVGSTDQVIAPMPGTILEVYVSPGDHVCYKQDLCTLEAMKMKNAIRAPREGVISEVRVQLHQTVAYGDVLFAFEPV